MDLEEIKQWRSYCDPDDIDFGGGPVLEYLDWLIAAVERRDVEGHNLHARLRELESDVERERARVRYHQHMINVLENRPFGTPMVLTFLDRTEDQWLELLAELSRVKEEAEVREVAYQAEIKARAKAEAELLAQSVVRAQVEAFGSAADISLRVVRGEGGNEA
jgi:hypothetical protein